MTQDVANVAGVRVISVGVAVGISMVRSRTCEMIVAPASVFRIRSISRSPSRHGWSGNIPRIDVSQTKSGVASATMQGHANGTVYVYKIQAIFIQGRILVTRQHNLVVAPS